MLILYLVAVAVAVIFLVFVGAGFLAIFAGPRGRGVPFVPTSRMRVQTMVRLVGPLRGKRVADLGSGDGRIVLAFAGEGAEAHGYELNPVFVWWSRIRIALAGLGSRAHVHWRNYWSADVSGFDVVVVFGLRPMMGDLEEKLRGELKPGAVVLSNDFAFPAWECASKENGVRMYVQGERATHERILLR